MDKSKREDVLRKWGTGIFENDADGLTVVQLFKESGVKEGHSTSFLYPGDVDPIKYRKKLDAGVLDKMLKKRLPIDATTTQYDKDTLWLWPLTRCPGYKLCLLGAIAMQLGCRIRPDFRQTLEELHTKVGFSRNAQVQLRHALNIYVDGIPYNFRWKHRPAGLKDDDFATDSIWGDISEILINCGEEAEPAKRLIYRQIFGPMLKCTFAGDTEHPLHACGNCGRKEAKNGSPCRPCSLCGQRLYCSRQCELAHRPKHQLICDDPDYRKRGNAWAKSCNNLKKKSSQRLSQATPKKHPRITELDDETADSDGPSDTPSAKPSPESSSPDRKWCDLDDEPKCGNCGMKASPDKPLSMCKKCDKQPYCNKKCQKADWSEHKKRCLTSTST